MAKLAAMGDSMVKQFGHSVVNICLQICGPNDNYSRR